MLPSSKDAYTALQNFKTPDAQSVLTQAQGQYGVADQQKRVSDLRGTVNNLQSSLNAVDPSVTGRTSGTFTTEAQRQALVGKEQAPIATNLNAAGTNLNTATGDLNTAEGNANSLASALFGQGQQQYQKLLDQYNASAAYEKQQQDQQNALAAQKLEQDKLTETKREADMSAKGGIDLSQFLTGSQPKANLSQRSDGGFNFTNTSGKPISAATYASLTGADVASVLRTMAQNGDKYAAGAYTSLGKAKTPQARQQVMKNYSSLFWGAM